MKALVRFYFHVDPDTLSVDKFLEMWGELMFALEFDTQRNAPKKLMS